jgi:TPR repeat protein
VGNLTWTAFFLGDFFRTVLSKSAGRLGLTKFLMALLPNLGDILARLAALEEQLLRHEAEISMVMRGSAQRAAETRPGNLEPRISRIERMLKSEQLYRQSQELLFGESKVRKNISTGLSRLKESACLGHPDSAFVYGRLLCEGELCDRNVEEATHFFRVSADQGHAAGPCAYGVCLGKGTGIEKNEAEAATYYKLSADQGYAVGQVKYGVCLEYGTGIEKNEAEAVRYYKLSADQGHADGQRCDARCLRLAR